MLGVRGVLGVLGVPMLLSNRYMPPIGGPLSVNACPLGLRSSAGNVALPGVMGDSVFSIVATDNFRILRLDCDMFFRIVDAGSLAFPTSTDRPGEVGTEIISSTLTCDSPCVRAGVAGDSLCKELAE